MTPSGQPSPGRSKSLPSTDPLCAIVYQLRDRGTSTSDSEQMFGLVRNDFTRKPYFQTVANEIKQHQPSPSLCPGA